MDWNMVERGENSKELRDNVGTLVEVVAVDVGVDLFHLVKGGATL